MKINDDNVFGLCDISGWSEINQKNLKLRKREWAYIKPIIRNIYRFETVCCDCLSLHKELFFKGTVPQKYIDFSLLQKSRLGGYNFLSNFVFFYLWYHPNLTSEIVNRVLLSSDSERFDLGGENEVALGVYKGLTDWSGLGCMSTFSEYGMMGGNEKIITPILLLGKEGLCLEEGFVSSCVNASETTIINLLINSSSFILSEKGPNIYANNPRNGAQTLWPVLSRAVEKELCSIEEYLKNNRDEIYLVLFKKVIRKLLHFTYIKKSNDVLVSDFVSIIMAQYRNNEFSGWLQELFSQEEEKMRLL